jgi:N-acyl homoserine lactone hydrolase
VRKHLQNIGVMPDEITTLVISHFHDDHVRNFDYFPRAQILLHEVEANWALGGPDDFAFPQHLFPAVQQTGRLELIKTDCEIAPGVETILIPGHTPGCMGLVLRDADRPVTVLSGDAIKNIGELATGVVDKSEDPSVSARSIKKVRDIAGIVIPGHDRILQVLDDKIVALTAARQTLVIPNGVANSPGPRYLELTIEQTSLPKEEIVY